jgi:hypothetical protein
MSDVQVMQYLIETSEKREKEFLEKLISRLL